MNSYLLRGGQIITMDDERRVFKGDLLIRENVIAKIASHIKPSGQERVIDVTDQFVLPGLIQTHTHLCQTLFRGLADDLQLLDWLQKKIWPFEKAHSPQSLSSSAQVGLSEMQLLGTTSILDMGTVSYHDVVFTEAEASGMRYWGGNCLMDLKSTSGPLYQTTEAALAECERLIKKWHKKTPLLNYAVSPRFVISCSENLLKLAAELQDKHGLLMHTHASENKKEVALVKKRTGLYNVSYLNKLKLLNKRTVIAHGIHLTKSEIKSMVRSQAGLAHCPSSNLKLASGIARIHEYLEQGMKVSLGSDGAPCNNTMDPFLEMRLCALLQKPIFGPTALPAKTALELATRGGAKVLNAEDKIGSLEEGKQADVITVGRNHPSLATVEEPYSALVYSASGRDVKNVWIAGKSIVLDQKHQIYDLPTVIKTAQRELSELLLRLRLKI